MGADFDKDDDEEMELEDLDNESEGEENEAQENEAQENEASDNEASEHESVHDNPEAETQTEAPQAEEGWFANKYRRAKEAGGRYTEQGKAFADKKFDSALTGANDFYDKHKNSAFSIIDSFKDIKDEMKDASKGADGKFAKFKSQVGVLTKHAMNSKMYKSIQNSAVGRTLSKGSQMIRTGANAVKNSAFGKWVAKKLESDGKPGVMSKLWGGIKSGVGKAWDGVKTGAGKAWDWAKNSKAGKWIAEKLKKDDKPGLLSRMWGGIKSGAGKAWDWAKNTKLGKWVGEKLADKEPGFFSKMFGKIKGGASWLINKAANTSAGKWIAGEYGKGKKWINEQKGWLEEKKQRLLEFKNKVSDEMDDHEHERRMAYKAKQGDPDYENRYNEYVDELKNNDEIQALVSKLSPADIKRVMDELENGVEDEGGKKEEGGSGVMSTVGKAADFAGGVAENDGVANVVEKHLGKKAADYAPGALYGVNTLINTGSNAMKAYKFGKRADEQKALSKEVQDKKLQSLLGRASDQNEINKVSSTADAALDISTGVNKIAKTIPGGSTIASIASAAGTGIKVAKHFKVSSMEESATKRALKNIVGGPEGYRALKAKYRLQAQEMRRGMREAVGMRSEKDVAQLEDESLIDYAKSKAAEGDENAKKTINSVGKDAIADMQNNAFNARNNVKKYKPRAAARAM